MKNKKEIFPFRDYKNPNLSVNRENQHLYYFACGASMDKNFKILSLAIWQTNIVFWDVFACTH